MLVLFESPLGYCLFRLQDSGSLTSKDLYKSFEDPTTASELVKLKAIHRFESTASAVEDLTSIAEGKLSKSLKKFLTTSITSSSKKGKEKETLIVAEPKLGQAIMKKLEIPVQAESTSLDLFRGIRSQLVHLLKDSDPSLGLSSVEDIDLATMRLGLGHSISRYKLKFSPDKVDTMVVQAVVLLDELDKEINVYSMRVKEWYGWHFPELSKILTDNLAYAKTVKAIGFRSEAAKADLSPILPEDLEESVKAASQISMGTEISDADLSHILSLCDQVISITTYRTELYNYLSSRMATIAPNLTALLGELVGARLIAHSGNLSNLAKHPASTIQILGAEKALFRALKTKKDTPKYGLIFHSSLVGMAPPKLKGKMARMVATKAALSIRLDALRDEGEEGATIGVEERTKLERRLRHLEEGLGIKSVRKEKGNTGNATSVKLEWGAKPKQYKTEADALIPTARATDVAMEVDDEREGKKEKKKKEKAKKRKENEMEVDIVPPTEEREETKEERKARKKAKKEAKLAAAGVTSNGQAIEDDDESKGKKRKHEIVEKEDKQIDVDQPIIKKRKEGETEEEKKKRKEEKKKRKAEKKKKAEAEEDSD